MDKVFKGGGGRKKASEKFSHTDLFAVFRTRLKDGGSASAEGIREVMQGGKFPFIKQTVEGFFHGGATIGGSSARASPMGRGRSSPMGAPTPSGFCGAGRRRAKSVVVATVEPFDEPAMQKPPALKGCARAGARFVAPLDRCHRIALRVAPGGSPRPRAT